MAAFRQLALAGLLSLAMAGCQTPSGPSANHGLGTSSGGHERSIPLASVTVVPEEVTIAPPAPLVAPTPPPAAPVLTSAPPPSNSEPSSILHPPSSDLRAPAWPTNWTNGWIPMQAWGRYNGLGKPIHHVAGPVSTYDFQTTNGPISLKIGSRVALCNGLECWLGYAPQVVRGVPCVYWLDAHKTLQPLLGPLTSAFKGERTIVLDPGHGGKDSGAKSGAQTAFEKDYALDWALRLRALLITNGWKVLLTRTNDLDVSLSDRVAVADRAKADLFLSLHFNSALLNARLAGVETYCLTPVGLPSSLVRDYEDNPQQAFPNNALDEQNFQLAWRLHQGVVQTLCAADRGLRRARFMSVLRAQNRPAVLIEAGYLSNAAEAGKIATADYRQKLAEAVARALE